MGSLTTNIPTNQGEPSPADYVHFLRFLLDGVSAHVIEGASRDLHQFRSEISTLSGKLTEQSSCADISSALHSGLKTLASYNNRTARFVAELAKTGNLAEAEPAGGLLDRSAAEEAISQKIASSKDCVCGMFLVNRLASIHARFGRGIGHEVIMLVAERLARQLPPGASIFQWKEPALIALVEVEGNVSEVNRRFTRAASMTLEKNIETENRFIMVPINLSFMLKRFSGSGSAPEIFQEMDRFVSVNTGENGNMLQ